MTALRSLIQIQGEVNERILGLSVQLERRGEFDSVKRMCEVRRYRNKDAFEACVDVETKIGVAVSFWFEIGIENNNWYVVASVNQYGREGFDSLEEYPESFPKSVEQLIEAATHASEWLARRCEEFDFANLR